MNSEEVFALLRRADPAHGGATDEMPAMGRTPATRWVKPAVVLATAVFVTVLAFGPLGLLGGDPVAVLDPDADIVGVPTSQSSNPAKPVASAPDTSVTPPVTSGAGLLLADGSSVIDVESGAVLVDDPAVVAYDDLAGGVVFQIASASYFGDVAGTDVWHHAAEAPEPRLLMAQDGDATLNLHGVFEVEGTPTAVVTERRHPTDVEDTVEVMYEVDLRTGAVHEVGSVGSWERGAAGISWDGSTYLLNTFAEGYTSLQTLDRRGNRTPWSGAPAGECFDQPECPRLAAATPDGRFLVYTRGDLIDRTELVLWDRSTDAMVWSVELEGGPILGPILVADDTIVLNHYTEGDAAPGVAQASVVALDSGLVSRVGTPGFVDVASLSR